MGLIFYIYIYTGNNLFFYIKEKTISIKFIYTSIK